MKTKKFPEVFGLTFWYNRNEELENILYSINFFLKSILVFRTNEVRYLTNILPYLVVQLKLLGFEIIQVQQHYDNTLPETTVILEITFIAIADTVRSLVYISSILNVDISSKIFQTITKAKSSILVVHDFPGYFEKKYEIIYEKEHCNYNTPATVSDFEKANRLVNLVDYLTLQSKLVIQSDHGIPIHWFEESNWKFNLFGKPGPIDGGVKNYFHMKLLEIQLHDEVSFTLQRYPRKDCTIIDENENINGIWFSGNLFCVDFFL